MRRVILCSPCQPLCRVQGQIYLFLWNGTLRSNVWNGEFRNSVISKNGKTVDVMYKTRIYGSNFVLLLLLLLLLLLVPLQLLLTFRPTFYCFVQSENITSYFFLYLLLKIFVIWFVFNVSVSLCVVFEIMRDSLLFLVIIFLKNKWKLLTLPACICSIMPFSFDIPCSSFFAVLFSLPFYYNLLPLACCNIACSMDS